MHITITIENGDLQFSVFRKPSKNKDKVHPFRGTEAAYRPCGP